MNNLFTQFCKQPEDPELNFLLGLEYEKIGHTASASSHYFRCSERSDDELLVYECFLRNYFCFQSQGRREYTAKHLLKFAITLQPKRPEGFFLLARHHERKHEWYETYVFSSLGLSNCDFNTTPLRTDVEYPGKYGLLYEKALSAWYWERVDESQQLLLEIKKIPGVQKEYLDSVEFNLSKIK